MPKYELRVYHNTEISKHNNIQSKQLFFFLQNQYVFVHKVLVENHMLARTDFNLGEFPQFYGENLQYR